MSIIKFPINCTARYLSLQSNAIFHFNNLMLFSIFSNTRESAREHLLEQGTKAKCPKLRDFELLKEKKRGFRLKATKVIADLHVDEKP